MRIARQPLLVWFGVLGAPLAWTLQLWSGIGLTLAACSTAGRSWDVPVHGVAATITIVAALVALAAIACAASVFRSTAGASGAPPGGRVHFLATIGIAVSVLFCVLIVMTGIGVASLDLCVQG